MLLLIDLAFVIVTVFNEFTGMLPYRLADMGEDNSPGEFFQYAKQLAVAVLVYRAATSWRVAIWSPVFVYLLLDDAFRLHEEIGGGPLGSMLAEVWDLEPAYHYGQLAYAVLAGLVVLPLLAVVYAGASEPLRRAMEPLAMAVALFVVFGSGLDFLASQLHGVPFAEVLGVLEEVGEHVAMSFAVWAAAVYASP